MNDKFDILIDMIQEIDGRRITSPLSDYGTVVDIYNQYKKNGKITQPQLYLINEIYKCYRRKEVIQNNRR